MLSSFIPIGENPGRLDNNIDFQISPWQVARVSLGQNLQQLTVYGNTAFDG